MTRGRLLQEIDSLEINDWIAFHVIKDEKEEKKKFDDQQKLLHEKFKAAMAGKMKNKGK